MSDRETERTFYEPQDAEKLFGDFCRDIGVYCCAVKESSEPNEKSPDFVIFPSGHPIIVEVKQVCPNKEDRESIESFKEKGWGEFGESRIGDRVRKKINEARPQFKDASKHGIPTMLVLHSFNQSYIDMDKIRLAMYGFDHVTVHVPEDMNQNPTWSGLKSGSGKVGRDKKMGCEEKPINTSISAVAQMHDRVPCEDNPNKFFTYLGIVHNRFASNRIDPEWMRNIKLNHLTVDETGLNLIEI